MADRYGCRLVAAYEVGDELVGEFECPDAEEGRPLTTAALLQGLAEEDAAVDPIDPGLVLSIRSAGANAARAAHAWVLANVRFREELTETFQSPRATFELGDGDCDDSARALAGLARAAGVPARLVFFLQRGSPIHVCAQLWYRRRWCWAETTLPAKFGEHPFDCLARIGMHRPDIDGDPVVLAPEKGPAMGRMMGALVQRSATPVTAQALANALAAVWPSVVGGSPGYAIQVLVAQSAFETGRWAYCWNWNLGNVKGTDGDYFTMTAPEGYGATATNQVSNFRSYASLTEGTAAWLRVLANGYPTALQYAEQGDVADFVSSLASGGYFTGDPDVYSSKVQSLYSEYQGLAPSVLSAHVQTLIGWRISEPWAVAIAGLGLLLGAALAVKDE
jgi:hypothetical protein